MGPKAYSIATLLIVFIGKLRTTFAEEFAVLAAESAEEKENFCLIYYPDFSTPPAHKSDAKFYMLQDESIQDFCNDLPAKDNYHGKFVLLKRSNCSLAEQARVVAEMNGEGALFITPSGKIDSINVNSTDGPSINITVALISETSVEKLKAMGISVTVRIFAPKDFSFDFSLVAIFIIAAFTVYIGSYWSGIVRLELYNKEINKLPKSTDNRTTTKPSSHSMPAEDSSLNVSPYYVAFFVCCMGAMLMLLYFFFQYLVYIIIALFALASCIAVYNCLEPLFLRIPFNFWKVSGIHCGRAVVDLDIRQLLLLIFSFGLSITWLVLRRMRYSWVLQDILGVAFCIHMLKSIRLPNLKICALLLTLLFFYDIFFVFVTPFLTMKGESVMEEVATGGKSSEMLPMVLRVVHFGFDPLSVCYEQYSLLGFGDILIPGLLLSYLYGFDLIKKTDKLYFRIAMPMYCGGLLFTFAGLFFMGTAQPALLYIVPSILIPTMLAGYLRGEFVLLWNGFKKNKGSVDSMPNQIASSQTDEVANSGPNTNVDSSQIDPSVVQTASLQDQENQEESVPEISIDCHGEKKHLLR